jgi:hypothetical protein
MGERASATAELRHAVDGLLGMQPLDPAGAAPAPSRSVASSAVAPVLLSTDQATVEVQQAGDAITRSDEQFANASTLVRREMQRAPTLRSAWLEATGPWTTGTSAVWVGQLARSTSLRPVHLVTLVRFRLDPALLPSLTGTVPFVAPPTSTLGVTVVVTNGGNVGERGVVVEASTTEPATASGGPTTAAGTPSKVTVSLPPGHTTVVALAPLRVHPGETYLLTVSVVPPDPQPAAVPVQQTVTIAVAPPAPPTTTTTLPRTTTTSPKGGPTTRPSPTAPRATTTALLERRRRPAGPAPPPAGDPHLGSSARGHLDRMRP